MRIRPRAPSAFRRTYWRRCPSLRGAAARTVEDLIVHMQLAGEIARTDEPRFRRAASLTRRQAEHPSPYASGNFGYLRREPHQRNRLHEHRWPRN